MRGITLLPTSVLKSFFVFSVWSMAPALSAQEPVNEVQLLLDQLDGFQSSFIQTVTEEDGYLLDEQEGILSFEKPNRIFWQVTVPYRSVLVADGDNIYYHDEDLNQVRIRPWSANPADNPAAVFVGEGDLRDYYLVEKIDNRFLLTPRDEDAGYKSLVLTFEEGIPTRMELEDSLGQKTDIQFDSLDQNLPAHPYQFSIPVDAEVIFDD
jgi:outer membrane lipoprotein carrier protein